MSSGENYGEFVVELHKLGEELKQYLGKLKVYSHFFDEHREDYLESVLEIEVQLKEYLIKLDEFKNCDFEDRGSKEGGFIKGPSKYYEILSFLQTTVSDVFLVEIEQIEKYGKNENVDELTKLIIEIKENLNSSLSVLEKLD